LYDLQTGILLGVFSSFAIFIQETAGTAPVKLDVDAGLVASHAIWGIRSARVVARMRGAIRLISFQGFLFFAAVQPALREAAKQHLKGDTVIFLVIDLSAVLGMDDSSPQEFKTLASMARKVGTSLVFCGAAPGILTKLRKAGTFPVDHTEEILEGDDLSDPAQVMANLKGGEGSEERWENRFFVIETTDLALEFCELTLALRTVMFCAESVAPPSEDLQRLGQMFNRDLAHYKQSLDVGDFIEAKQGETFVLIQGAVEASVKLQGLDHKDLRPEAVVVYRSLEGLELDYCFSGGAPGTLECIEPAECLMIPESAIQELRDSGHWPEVEVLWSQLAEFMASAMHPLAMKATMHDVHGTFSSAARESYETAVADYMQEAGPRPNPNEDVSEYQRALMQKVLEGSGERMRQLRKSITVNFGGEQPVFSGLHNNRSRVGSTASAASAVSGAGAGRARGVSFADDVKREDSENASKSKSLKQMMRDKGMTMGSEDDARSRTSTVDSGAIMVGDDMDGGVGPQSIGRSRPPKWSVDLQFALCGEGQEQQYRDKAMFLDPDEASSVAAAVAMLNTRAIQCPEGFCVVFSAKMRTYFVVFDENSKDVARSRLAFSSTRTTPSPMPVASTLPPTVSSGRAAPTLPASSAVDKSRSMPPARSSTGGSSSVPESVSRSRTEVPTGSAQRSANSANAKRQPPPQAAQESDDSGWSGGQESEESEEEHAEGRDKELDLTAVRSDQQKQLFGAALPAAPESQISGAALSSMPRRQAPPNASQGFAPPRRAAPPSSAAPGSTQSRFDGFEPKLYHASKVGRDTKVMAVPLTQDALNDDDAFVLDTGETIYVYAGDKASPHEKNAANLFAENIESNRGSGICKATQQVDDEFWKWFEEDEGVKPSSTLRRGASAQWDQQSSQVGPPADYPAPVSHYSVVG
jgi:anti-anti-sigma regulatory factor